MCYEEEKCMMGLFNDANDDMKEILHEEQKNLNKDFLCKGMCGW